MIVLGIILGYACIVTGYIIGQVMGKCSAQTEIELLHKEIERLKKGGDNG